MYPREWTWISTKHGRHASHVHRLKRYEHNDDSYRAIIDSNSDNMWPWRYA